MSKGVTGKVIDVESSLYVDKLQTENANLKVENDKLKQRLEEITKKYINVCGRRKDSNGRPFRFRDTL